MKNSWFFLLAVFTLINCSLSQIDIAGNKNDNSILKKIYIKGGIDISSYYNQNILKYDKFGDDISYWGSMAYNYSKQLQFEIMYKYLGRLEYNYSEVNIHSPSNYFYDIKYDVYYPNNIYFKTNYFLNKNKRINPIYYTGSLILSLERVKNSESTFNETFDSVTHYIINETFSYNVLSSYYRLLFGSAIGFGIFLDLGHFNVQTEFSYSARVSPFVNKGFKENSFDLSLAGVYKF